MAKKYRVNDQIRIPTVRVITETGDQLGIMSIEDARKKADEMNLDLVEVAPNAKPPVCRIIDFGKHLYKQKKQEQKQKKTAKQTEVKGIRIGFSTEEHDLDIKAKQANKFLKNGNVVKVQMMFKGRELAHMDKGKEKLMEFTKKFEEEGTPDAPEPKRHGHNLTIIVLPNK